MSTDSMGGPTGRTRASDAEREEFARLVRDAVGDGRLSLDEGDERLAAIYTAKYRDELRPLVTDLPREEERYGGPGGPRRGRRDGRGAGPGSESRGPGPGPEGRGGPEDPRWRGRPGFAGPAVALVVAAVLVGIWALSSAQFFWPAIPLFFLGLILLRRACGIRYGYNPHRRW